MAEAIRADALERGDIYADRGELKRVDSARIFVVSRRTVEVTYTNVNTNTGGVVSFADWSTVIKVKPASTDEALMRVADLQPSENLRLWRRVDGGFYL